MTDTSPTAVELPGLEALLEHLKSERGFDFTGYKRASLQRRIEKRMGDLGMKEVAHYLDHLQANPQEFEDLFDTLLINVTGFFRDMPAWEFMRKEIVPRVLDQAGPTDPIRIWSAGCASGEEPYTLAMVFAEAMGIEDYLRRVKVYATDVDHDALATARAATYPSRALEAVPPELRERYFERLDGRHAFRVDVRRTVIFGRNDLVQDAPISRIDLLVCRNVLMYLTAEAQARVLERFNFALKPDGYLFLGKSEMLITHSELFKPVALKERVFTRGRRGGGLSERLAGVADAFSREAHAAPVSGLMEAAFDSAALAQVLVDGSQRVVLASSEARRLFGLSGADVGRPLRDLELSYRPVELRALIDQSRERGEPVEVDGLRFRPANQPQRILKVRVLHMGAAGSEAGASIAYFDVTHDRELQDELRRSKQDLESAYEELQSAVEELETTNEELQSTNEELETTNEELQSTNEELETMNEELQSTNEELETMNDELRERGLELNRANGMLETILTSLEVSLVVVDRSQRIVLWNSHSENVWGLRADEAEGEHVLGLDIGFPVERLREPLRACLGGAERQEVVSDAVDRRGRPFTCHVTVLPVAGGSDDGAVTGALVLMEPSRR